MDTILFKAVRLRDQLGNKALKQTVSRKLAKELKALILEANVKAKIHRLKASGQDVTAFEAAAGKPFTPSELRLLEELDREHG